MKQLNKKNTVKVSKNGKLVYVNFNCACIKGSCALVYYTVLGE